MTEIMGSLLKFITDEFTVILTAMLPVIEVRGPSSWYCLGHESFPCDTTGIFGKYNPGSLYPMDY